MKITFLSLKQFRNFHDIEINFKKKHNLFYGNNAQGKTNLLEAIYYCSYFSSFRNSRQEQLINKNADHFSIAMRYEHNSLTNLLKINYYNKHKNIIYNNKKMRNPAAHYKKFITILFSNEDMQLINGSPAVRRIFIDRLLSHISDEYHYIIKRYTKIIKNRNLELKTGNDPSKWNEVYLNYALKIVNARLSFLKILNKYFSTIINTLYGAELKPELYYLLNNKIIKPAELYTRHSYLQAGDNFLEIEKIKKNTVFGPHKDDLLFKINGMDLKDFGSQGQKRIFIYALKFTIFKYLKSSFDNEPILLLDDIFSDLDNIRIKNFFNYLEKCSQVFLSSANYFILKDHISNFDLFSIKNNSITNGTFVH